MSDNSSGEIACHGCDLLVNIGTLQDGDAANCPRCGGFLTRYRKDAYNRVLAFATSGLILLLLANSYEFLAFSSNGVESQITLRETPAALWENGMPLVAMLVGGFIIAIPAAVLMMLIGLCIPLNAGQYRFWLPSLTKTIMRVHNWAMAEVFIIGVIVSLVKLSSMATVVVGISFWAYAGFTIFFILAISGLDRYQCWRHIEELASQ